MIYFQRLLQANSRQGKLFQKAMTVSERAQLASYEVAEIIALKSNSHVLAESVILPACQKMAKVMLGDKAEQDISKIPFSNSTIQRRIINLSGNIEQSVMAELKNYQFALHIDEFIDVSKHAQLIACVRFIDEGVISKISLLQEFTLHYKRSRCLLHSYNLPQKPWLILEFLCRHMHRLNTIPGRFRFLEKLYISCGKMQSYHCANSLFLTW